MKDIFKELLGIIVAFCMTMAVLLVLSACIRGISIVLLGN